MKIALIAKFRNGALVQLLQEKGWTQADFARAVGVGQTVVSNWMQMKDYPHTPALRQRVEVATGYLCEDLFPPEVEHLRKEPLPREVTVIREMDPRQLLHRAQRTLVASPEVQALATERVQLFEALLATLTPREQWVVRARFGFDDEPQTLNSISQQLGVSAERVRAIEAHALRKLQHPTRAKALQHIREGT